LPQLWEGGHGITYWGIGKVKSAAWSLESLLMELFVVRSLEANQGAPADQVNFNK
jgi:hypothetical protein